MDSLDSIRSAIRDVPDFPKPGINYKDITPLLQNPTLFESTILQMKAQVAPWSPTKIVAIESRGFLFGAPLALKLGVGLSVVRKPKKLPYKTTRVEYSLEYGTDALEMHVDALEKRDRVVIVDDILATGGTAKATAQLVTSIGASVVGFSFLGELGFLNGRKQLAPYEAKSLLEF